MTPGRRVDQSITSALYRVTITPIPPAMRQHLAAEIVVIEGPDALPFAQSQFSSNVPGLPVGHWHFSAWLDPQGRTRRLFHLARPAEHRLVLVLRGGEASTMVEGLKRFVFRAKVSIEAQPRLAIRTGEPMDMHQFSGSDVYALGCGDHSMVIGPHEGDDTWRTLHIQRGWPWLPDEALEQYVPQAISLERLQAVALDKGCYPGQEIVARMHYRGGNKRHLHCVVLSHRVNAGGVLRKDDRELASLLDVMHIDEHSIALAIIPDSVIDAENAQATLATDDGIQITPTHRWPA